MLGGFAWNRSNVVKPTACTIADRRAKNRSNRFGMRRFREFSSFLAVLHCCHARCCSTMAVRGWSVFGKSSVGVYSIEINFRGGLERGPRASSTLRRRGAERVGSAHHASISTLSHSRQRDVVLHQRVDPIAPGFVPFRDRLARRARFRDGGRSSGRLHADFARLPRFAADVSGPPARVSPKNIDEIGGVEPRPRRFPAKGEQRGPMRVIIGAMPFPPKARTAILRRLAQLESELRQARADLRNLRHRDPATSEVVMRGAKLSRERNRLERRLEVLGLDPTQLADHSSNSNLEHSDD